jgi:hypothetical protein
MVDSADPVQDPMAGPCDSINDGELLDQLSDYQLLKEDLLLGFSYWYLVCNTFVTYFA